MKSPHPAVSTLPRRSRAAADQATLDPAAFHVLEVPVAWADGSSALLGANAAFAAATGHTVATCCSRPLASLLGLPAQALAGLAGAGWQPLAGKGANQRALTGQLSLRQQRSLQVLTLQVSTRQGLQLQGQPTQPLPTQPSAAPTSTPPSPAADALLDHVRRLGQIGVWQRDLRSGVGVWDDNTWRFWGLPPGDKVPCAEATLRQIHPDDRALAGDVLRQSKLAVGRYAHRLRVQAPGAALRHVRMVWQVLPGADGLPAQALGIMVDDTAVHALTQRLDMATAAAGVGVWSVTLDGPDGIHWNAQMRALHGWAPEALVPNLAGYLAGCVHPDDRASVSDALGTLLRRSDGLLDLDLRVVLPSGAVRRLATRSSISGAPGQRHLHGVMLDVTERHETESRLRQAQERALLAARGAGIGTWESDADAAVGWWDAQMFHLRGRPPRAEPVHLSEMLTWLHPDDSAKHAQQMGAAAHDGLTLSSEFRVLWPDGSVRWLASSSSPVRDAQGRTVGRVGINWDVTDAHNAATARAEQLLARHESQAKSRFLARISHELRTPLNAVLGFSQLLLAGVPQPTPAHGAAGCSMCRPRVNICWR